jgi:hypothetical protein
MAYHQLGQKDLAQTELAEASRAIRMHWPGGENDAAGWQDWLIAYVLLQEAEELIHSPADSAVRK